MTVLTALVFGWSIFWLLLWLIAFALGLAMRKGRGYGQTRTEIVRFSLFGIFISVAWFIAWMFIYILVVL